MHYLDGYTKYYSKRYGYEWKQTYSNKVKNNNITTMLFWAVVITSGLVLTCK